MSVRAFIEKFLSTKPTYEQIYEWVEANFFRKTESFFISMKNATASWVLSDSAHEIHQGDIILDRVLQTPKIQSGAVSDSTNEPLLKQLGDLIREYSQSVEKMDKIITSARENDAIHLSMIFPRASVENISDKKELIEDSDQSYMQQASEGTRGSIEDGQLPHFENIQVTVETEPSEPDSLFSFSKDREYEGIIVKYDHARHFGFIRHIGLPRAIFFRGNFPEIRASIRCRAKYHLDFNERGYIAHLIQGTITEEEERRPKKRKGFPPDDDELRYDQEAHPIKRHRSFSKRFGRRF